MKIFILAILLSAFVGNLQARDISLENLKNSLGDGIDENTEYEILLQNLGKIVDIPEDVNFISPRSGGDNYGYNSDSEYPPSRWQDKWPTCGGLKQSPINVDPSACSWDLSLFKLKLYKFDHPPISTTVTNVGHSIQYSFNFNKNAPYVTRGILRLKKYNFAQLHFHFGKTDGVGSEHTIGSKSYALETHLVFYNSNYADVSEASQHPDGLLVIGILFQASDNAPSLYFTEHLSRVKNSGDTISVRSAKGMRLSDFIGSLDFKYVRYEGSLTTPPCSEAVTWYVSTNIREISRKDLAAFRAVNGDEGIMAGNNRPTQDINSRKCFIH